MIQFDRMQYTIFSMTAVPSDSSRSTEDLSRSLGTGGTLLADALGVDPTSIDVLSEPEQGEIIEVLRCPPETGVQTLKSILRL